MKVTTMISTSRNGLQGLCFWRFVHAQGRAQSTTYRGFASGLLWMPRDAPSQPPHPRADGPKPRAFLFPRPHPHNRPPAKAPFGLASGVFTLFREVLMSAFTLLLLAGVAVAQEQIKEEGGYYVERFEREIKSSKGGTLDLDTERGSISIKSWDRDLVKIVLEKRADVFTEEEARRVFADFDLDVAVESGGKKIVLRGESRRGRRSSSPEVHFEIKVPSRYNIILETSGGEIEVGDLEGNVEAETSGGSIAVGLIKKGSVKISTSGGSLRVKGVDGGDVKAETSGGSIDIGDVSGDVKAETAGGSIQVKSVGGELIAETAGGSIKIGEGGKAVVAGTAGGSIEIGKSAGPVEAKTAGGSIRIGPTKGAVRAETAGGSIGIDEVDGPVVAETAGGSIKINGATGNVEAETSGGSITVRGALAAVEAETAGGSIEVELLAGGGDRHCSLETSGGDVRLYLPTKIKATVDAEVRIEGWRKADYGIYSDFDLDIKKDEGRRVTARGKINGGGSLLRLRTTNGDIHIERK